MLSPCFSAPDLSPVQVPLIQTPLGQNDSGESDTDSSSSVSTPTATTGETTKEETTAQRRPVHGMYCRCRVPWLGWSRTSSFCLLFDQRDENEVLPESRKASEVCCSLNVYSSFSCFLLCNWFFLFSLV